MTPPRLLLTLVGLAGTLGVLSVSARPLPAQASPAVPAGTEHIHAIHVSPHVIFLNPTTHTATLTFSNTGNVPATAEIRIELGYLYFPGRDTALFPPHWNSADRDPRDTLLATPTPQDHFLGPWLAGVPTRLTLQPNQTQTVTLRLTPPPGLPDGEYYARIVTLVGKHQQAPSPDAKRRYALPVKGRTLPPMRDSVWVYYRQGPQRMGLSILQAEAHQDTSETAVSAFPAGYQIVRFLIRYHLHGPTHFDGRMEISVNGEVAFNGESGSQDAFPLYRDGIIRWLVAGPEMGRGRHTLVVRFLDWQKDLPPADRVPLDTAQVQLPFEIR